MMLGSARRLHMGCGESLRPLLTAAEAARPGEAPESWPDLSFADMDFAPPRWPAGGGPPHLRLDHAVEFLIGDKLA